MLYDYAIIGGGIIGLSASMHLLKVQKDANIILFEKESTLAKHQTGHNSGVVHSGIYYSPNSLKAKLCRDGLRATRNFCDEHKIPFKNCGKLIVATNPSEEQRIQLLFERSKTNGVKSKIINGITLKSIEPNIQGTKALFCPEAGIVEYQKIALKMAEFIKNNGGVIYFNTLINMINETGNGVELGDGYNRWRAKKLIVCGGLQADRLARIAGMNINFKIIPFRGEYFRLPTSKKNIIKHLVYPAPNPSLPFLGVHLTLTLDGSVIVGPNAALSFAREGYSKFSLSINDIASYSIFPGFWKLIWQHRTHALHELKSSLIKSTYLADCQKYCPSLLLNDLLPYGAGIRAQVVSQKGDLEHDFLFGQTDRMLHVFNAPSPAATSAIPIGRLIAEKSINVKIH